MSDVPALPIEPVVALTNVSVNTVTVVGASVIVNVPLTVFVAALLASLILTTAVVEVLAGNVHEYEPVEAATLATIVVHVEPASSEYSNITLVMPTLDHVIL